MDPSEEVPEQPEVEVDWTAGDQVGDAQLGTVEEVTLALVGLGVAPATLTELHEQGFTPGTPADQVPEDVWREIVAQSPEVADKVAQLNQFFHRLIRQGNTPVPSAKKPGLVHVYNATQLTAATGMGGVSHIAVHEGIDGAVVAAAAAKNTGKWLHLGPGVTVTGISGGYVRVYAGATVTGITDGHVSVNGGTATGITGGTVTVTGGGTATGISGGTVTVQGGGTATDVTGGHIHVHKGGTATGVTGGHIYVYRQGSVRVPAGIELHQDPGDPDVSFNGADAESSTLIINLWGGILLQD